MSLLRLATLRLLGLALLPLLLAACEDATLSVAVTSPDEAEATLVETISADAVVAAAAIHDGTDVAFCPRGALSEGANATLLCTQSAQGRFRSLAGQDSILSFTPLGSGLVRVSLATADLQAAVADRVAAVPDLAPMLDGVLGNRKLTVRFSGPRIVSSNIPVAKDLRTAETTISLLELARDTADLPQRFFAIIRVAP